MRISVLGLVPALALGVAIGGFTQIRADEPSILHAVAADTQFTLSGHGNGHGRGMGQWGAYGYAKNDGWSGERILSHYYGGTVLDSMPPAQMSVRLTAQDNSTLDVYSDAGLVVNGQRTAPGEAAHLTALPGGGAQVVVTSGCGGGVVWEAVTEHPWVDPVDLGPDRPADQFLKLCNNDAPYRGALGVVLDNGSARTVNLLDMEDYLLGVVPVEAKAEWADSGGAEALRAQAWQHARTLRPSIAARTPTPATLRTARSTAEWARKIPAPPKPSGPPPAPFCRVTARLLPPNSPRPQEVTAPAVNSRPSRISVTPFLRIMTGQ